MAIAVACGGTGGHIFPGLAVARALKNRGRQVVLWLAGRDVEGASVEGWDGPVVAVRAAGLPMSFSMRSVSASFQLARSAWSCRARMKKDIPDALLAMGSYASVGPVLGAWSLRVPVVLHEANAVPGRAISALSRCADAVAVSFQSAAPRIRHKRVEFTGFPLRDDLQARFESGVPLSGAFTVLVMGGSQGAHRLNEICSAALCKVHEQGVPVRALHITGAADEAMVRERYAICGVPNSVFPFLREIGKAYNAASLAITRAGAATCMELAACRVPALLVPLPGAPRDHQTANAKALQAAGQDMIPEKKLSSDGLADYIRTRRGNPAKLESMKARLRELVVPDAAERIADLILDLRRAKRPG